MPLSPDLADALDARYPQPDPDTRDAYLDALREIGLPGDCDLAEACMASIVPSFEREGQPEVYNVLWWTMNGSYPDLLSVARNYWGATPSQFPLTGFEGEYVYLYDAASESVYDIELGPSLDAFKEGRLAPRWSSFEAFLREHLGL